ncbi:MAG: hypothetical protein M3H12_15930, partial [Chromatiales bacterium]
GGPRFLNVEFQAFANTWEFKHSMSSPYHANGKMEAAIKIAKNLLKKSKDPKRAFRHPSKMEHRFLCSP